MFVDLSRLCQAFTSNLNFKNLKTFDHLESDLA